MIDQGAHCWRQAAPGSEDQLDYPHLAMPFRQDTNQLTCVQGRPDALGQDSHPEPANRSAQELIHIRAQHHAVNAIQILPRYGCASRQSANDNGNWVRRSPFVGSIALRHCGMGEPKVRHAPKADGQQLRV